VLPVADHFPAKIGEDLFAVFHAAQVTVVFLFNRLIGMPPTKSTAALIEKSQLGPASQVFRTKSRDLDAVIHHRPSDNDWSYR